VTADPLRLLRDRGPIEGYPLEPSDEELAEAAGVSVDSIVRYDMNTLGGGPLPGVRAAWADWDPAHAVDYGDLAYRRLRSAIGAAIGVPPTRIVPGAGADELIRLVTTSVCGPGDAVVVPVPTFPMFAVEARLAGASVVAVPRRDPGHRQRPEELVDAAHAAGARLVWLCSPNNPTGDVTPLDEVRAVAAALEAMVVVDEVYLEFAEASLEVTPESTSATTLQTVHDNVLVLRSMAKAYGLAGARAGYLVVPEGLAERFDALRLPLSVGSPTEALALGALSDPEAARARHRQIVDERRRLAATLERHGCRVLDSVANFVAFRPADAAELATALLRRGLVVRAYDTGPMAGWLRATARTAPDNDRLLAALDELMG